MENDNKIFDFAVIGAGVVGTLIARELTKYTKDVVVIERENDCACGATKANSAIVHAGFDAHEGSMKARFNVRGNEMYEKLCSDLGVKYERIGALVAASSDERDKVEELYRRGIENGVKELEIVEGERLKELEPSLCDELTVALFAPTSAITCPYSLAIAALGNAMDNGCSFERNFKVDKIEREDGIFAIYSGDKCIRAKAVVNAAGLYSDKIAAMVGDNDISVHARKGEYMLLDRASVGDVRHTIFTVPGKMGKGILVSPTVDGNLLLGPTAVDIDGKENRETTAEGIADVRAKSAKMVKKIAYGGVITSFTGLRAVGNTGDFIIRFSSPGFITTAGIESPGLTSAPAIAEYVAGMAKEAHLLPEDQREDFDPVRHTVRPFADMSDSEREEWIARDPSFARIVCRCENVTEGHIKSALLDNPRALDSDAVKRRTRSGMGKCQGGFCSPTIIKMLSQYGIPTKKGAGSELICGYTKKGVIKK